MPPGSEGSTDLLIRKLEGSGPLTALEQDALRRTEGTCVSVERHHDIIRAGDRPRSINILIEGFACRYTLLPDGKRQITAFHVPWDALDLPTLVIPEMDYSVCALVRSKVFTIPHPAMLGLLDEHPRIARLFWRETFVNAAIFREWMVGIGRRSAFARIAHLFCELILRLQAAGLGVEHEVELPLTQADIGDAFGLSTVHVNRTLQELRSAGLIKLTRGRLKAMDWRGLCEAGGFDGAYLHQRP